MLFLDTNTRSLEIVLAGAITTNQLPFTASYVDITPTGFTPATNDGASNSTTAVTIVAAPASSTQRQLKFVNIYNADTVAASVTVRLNDNATTRILLKTALNPGDTLQFMDTEGWSVISNNGQIKLGLSSRQFYMAAPANPTGTTSATGVMMGLAGSITPQGSGNVLIVISGLFTTTGAVAGNGVIGTARYGTGAAPSNAGVLAGTVLGSTLSAVNERAAADSIPFCFSGIATGLTPGTAYWIDLGIAQLGAAGTAKVTTVTVMAFEL